MCKSVGGSIQGQGISGAVVLFGLVVDVVIDVAVKGREVVVEETGAEKGVLTKRTK